MESVRRVKRPKCSVRCFQITFACSISRLRHRFEGLLQMHLHRYINYWRYFRMSRRRHAVPPAHSHGVQSRNERTIQPRQGNRGNTRRTMQPLPWGAQSRRTRRPLVPRAEGQQHRAMAPNGINRRVGHKRNCVPNAQPPRPG